MAGPAAAAATEPPPELGLLDVLEQVERKVLRQSLWLHLEDPLFHNTCLPVHVAEPHLRRWPGRAFRLTCSRSLHLCDQLTRSVNLVCTSGHRDDDATPQVVSAFLARQERLREVSLTERHVQHSAGEAIEVDMVSNTLRLSGLACQRVQSLHLTLSSTCCAALGTAVQASCPQLSELTVLFPTLEPTFLVPLRDCPCLEKLTFEVKGGRLDCEQLLGELAMLRGLRCVSLIGQLDSSALAQLAALTALQELCLRHVTVEVAWGDGGRLGGLLGGMTHPTKLETPYWRYPVADEGEFYNAVAAQLGGLRHLSSLYLSEGAWDEEDPQLLLRDSFAALLQLSGLTSLSCAAIAPQGDSSAGHLPLLQHLKLFDDISPYSLAATLLPLLPLRELRKVTCSVHISGVDSDRAAHVMWQAATLLAQAPYLQDIELGLDYEEDVAASSFGATTALLVPILEQLVKLDVMNAPKGCFEVLWPLLCRAPRLESLFLCGCAVTESVILAFGHHMSALTDLDVWGCDGLEGDSAVALAAVRTLPLRVTWCCQVHGVSPEQRQRFREVARPGVYLAGH